MKHTLTREDLVMLMASAWHRHRSDLEIELLCRLQDTHVIEGDELAAAEEEIVENAKEYPLDDEDDYRCSSCGESTIGGEGYDGLCGDCADKAENELSDKN